MLYVNKKNGKTYELTNDADAQGICQVYDKDTNSVMLMNFSELEYWKLAHMKARNAELKAIYQEGTTWKV